MPELNITGELTVEEIHKIREYNYEMTKNMTWEDRWAYYDKGAERVLKMLEELKSKPATA
jgi:hypothetical protein